MTRYVNVILATEPTWLTLCHCGPGNKDCLLTTTCSISTDEATPERDEQHSDVANAVVGYTEYNTPIKTRDMFTPDQWNQWIERAGKVAQSKQN